MSFSREVKDFLGGFQSGWKMYGDAELDAAKAKYYNSMSEEDDSSKNYWGYGEKPEQKSWFERTFASTDAPPGGAGSTDPYEKSAQGYLTAIDRALKDNNPTAAQKIEKDMELWHTMGKRYQKFFRGGPVRAMRDAVAIPEQPKAVEPPVEPKMERAPYEFGGDFSPDDLEYREEEVKLRNEDMKNRVVEDMTRGAADGIILGMDSIERNLQKAGGAVNDGTEAAQMFARGDGAVTPEAFKAMMTKIDPEGTLPKEAQVAAAIRYATDFYLSKNDPESAAAISNQLLMFSKNSSQVRGALAVQALQNGDIKSGAKLLADSNNYDLPFSELIKPAVAQNGDVIVNEDGSVPVKIVRGGVTQEEINATPDMIMQVAQQTATGQTWTQRVSQAVSRLKAERESKKTGGSGGGKSNIEGNTELIDAEIGRVMGIPAASQPAASQPAGATATTAPLPPERPEELQSPERRAMSAVGIPEYPSEAPADLRAPTKLPPVPDDTAPRTRTPFDVVERPVNDEFVERAPEKPVRPDYEPLPKFRAELLSPEALKRFEKMNAGQRSNFIREWNSRAAASAEKKKTLDAEYKAELKTYNDKIREIEKGNAPRVFDPGKADEFASSVDTSFKETLTEEKFKKLPSGMRGSMRDLAVDIGARNRNITSGGAADAVLALTRINEKNPDDAGFRVVRDPQSRLIYAQFPDGRTVRMSPESLTRLAALRTERRQQFEKEKQEAEANANKPDKLNRVIDTGKGAIGEIGSAVTGALNAPLQPQDAEITALRNWYNSAGSRNEAINDLKSRPEVREAMDAMERARMRNDRKAYQAAAQRLRSLTNERYDSAIPTGGY